MYKVAALLFHATFLYLLGDFVFSTYDAWDGIIEHKTISNQLLSRYVFNDEWPIIFETGSDANGLKKAMTGAGALFGVYAAHYAWKDISRR